MRLFDFHQSGISKQRRRSVFQAREGARDGKTGYRISKRTRQAAREALQAAHIREYSQYRGTEGEEYAQTGAGEEAAHCVNKSSGEVGKGRWAGEEGSVGEVVSRV